MRIVKLLFSGLVSGIVSMMPGCARVETAEPVADGGLFYGFTVKRLMGGEEVPLRAFQGKVVLVVNTASKCGFTPQYDGLEKVFERYREKGLVILGFPSNDFGGQEPGSNDDIAHFCKLNFGVSFPMFQKGPVTGAEKQPVYRYLTERANPGLTGEIKWNFEKFLIDRQGRLRSRFSSFVKPESGKLTDEIERLLAEGAA